MAIHPTALIDPAAVVAPDAEIGPYSVIGPDVNIGTGCVIGPHVVMHPHVRLGAGCTVHAGAVLGDLPQDLSFKPVRSFVEIGEHCVIREGVTIHRGTKEDTVTRVGAHCLLMANSHLAHNVELGNSVILANGVLLAGYVIVGSGVFMGGNAAVHQFVHVGRLAMLGGLCGISQDVPPFCTAASCQYNRLAGLNTIGLKRAGMSPEARTALKRAFVTLFRAGLARSEALDRIEQDSAHPEVREFVAFVRASKRGVCSGRDAALSGENP